MKKFICAVIALVAALACCFTVACKNVFSKEPVKADDNTVFITASESSFDFENKTLEDYMKWLQSEGKLTFEMSNGMITSLNGKSNTTNSYWMLYTDDTKNANNEWGTFEHEGKVYGSAASGASELKLTENCVYIWAYQTF